MNQLHEQHGTTSLRFIVVCTSIYSFIYLLGGGGLLLLLSSCHCCFNVAGLFAVAVTVCVVCRCRVSVHVVVVGCWVLYSSIKQ